MLFVNRFAFDLYPVNNDYFCPVVYRIKNPVVPTADTIAFFVCKLFGIMWSRIGCKTSNCLVNVGDIEKGFFGLLFGPSSLL